MIEITAKLTRGPVYFSGEMIKCHVTFRNVQSSRGDSIDSGDHGTSNDGSEMLGWGGAQIYCHCILDETRVHYPEDQSSSSSDLFSSRDTSFNPARSEKGHVVFSTTPKILFSCLTLGANESKTYFYSEKIPYDVPPSFYGSSVKYLYKLTIGTQRVNTVIQLLKIPLRILNASLMKQSSFTTGSDGETRTSSSPTQNLTEDEKLDYLIHSLERLTTRKSSSSYSITNSSEHVATFCLLKSSFKMGEDVVGVFNFSDAQVPCVQFSVTLESHEIISDECRVSKTSDGIRTSHSSCHEYCLHTSHSQIILPIPLTITPSFSTEIICLKWSLHFEFIITKSDQLAPVETRDSQGVMIKNPSKIHVTKMLWDLPIDIYATHPIQVARGLQLPSSSTLIV